MSSVMESVDSLKEELSARDNQLSEKVRGICFLTVCMECSYIIIGSTVLILLLCT